MKRMNKNQQGFTLMEAMIVVIIIGAMAALTIPNFNIQVKKARNQEATQILMALYGAQIDYESENPGSYATTLNDLDSGGFITLSTTSPKNFTIIEPLSGGSISCGGSGLTLARLAAKSLDYDLYVIDSGQIVCLVAPASFSCPDTLCTRMGYKAIPP